MDGLIFTPIKECLQNVFILKRFKIKHINYRGKGKWVAFIISERRGEMSYELLVRLCFAC